MAESPIARIKRPGPRPKKPRRIARRRVASKKMIKGVVAHESFPPVLLIALGFMLLCTLLIGVTRHTVGLSIGRIMDETRTVRVAFDVEDEEATRREREMRRREAPRVFRVNEPLLDQLERSIRTLPEALSVAETFDQVADEYREPFGLDTEAFEAVRSEGATPEGLSRWQARVDRLLDRLRETPLLSKEEHQAALNAATSILELRAGAETMTVAKSEALTIDAEQEAAREALVRELRRIAEASGFFGSRRDVVVNRILHPREPTFLFSREATEQRERELAGSVDPVIVSYRPGDVIFARGERLSESELALAKRENDRWKEALPLHAHVLYWLGVFALSGVLTLAVVMHLGMYYPRALTNPWRFLALCALVLAAAGLACAATRLRPGTFWLTLSTPVLFAAMMLVVAYDVRLALGGGAIIGLIASVAIKMPVAYFGALWAGVCAAAWLLHDIRNRSDVVRTSVGAALTLMVTVGVASLVYRPIGAPIFGEVLVDALSGGAGGFLAGLLVLAVLPTVERQFDIITGMTLTEWRDPRQPLLRELQTHAPGTFNHSHTVATLAEAAADAIGADSLHVYVGALYHDIGKINKPEYFIENQLGGQNKHTKLSPAMSLLVIVGHVKDGIELAREYGLPRSLHHYIESHHGTTLVEYFYDRAKKQADQDEKQGRPSEVEYRYPGPKPRTKEAAILMVCDAVESATRAMADPTPSRISALVHELATKRLVDGQFDECNLTLGELSRIEEAVTKALCSIYHGRIAYPQQKEEAPRAPQVPTIPGGAISG